MWPKTSQFEEYSEHYSTKPAVFKWSGWTNTVAEVHYLVDLDDFVLDGVRGQHEVILRSHAAIYRTEAIYHLILLDPFTVGYSHTIRYG